MRSLSLVIAVILTFLFSPFVVSLPAPADPDQKLPKVALSELNVGDIIFADVYVEKRDQAHPHSMSWTGRNIRHGKKAMKLAVVLVADNSGVQVTYLTTFGGESTLPSTLNEKNMWYPISPAENEDIYVPLPALKTNKAQWASLRQKQTITASSVKRVPESMTEASVELILNAMHG